MSNSPVVGYNPILFAAAEATFGVTPTPANVAAFAALGLATIEAKMGLSGHAPNTRAKQDRGLGRGMQDGYVAGRFDPVAFSVVASLKTRTAIDAAPRELAFFKAAGFKSTVNASTSYVLEPSPTPEGSGDFISASLTRILGRAPDQMELERLAGCLVQSLSIEGGDKEVMLSFAGVGSKKDVGGGLDSVTLADGVGTSLTVTADQSYQLAPNSYYQCENEIILTGTWADGATSIPITRAQLSSTGAAHAAKPFSPYIPTGVSYGGSPIPESLTTNVSFDGVGFRCTNWKFDITTGLEPLPGETGSAYFQGIVAKRYSATLALSFILKGDDVRKFNKARARKEVAVVITQGTGAGGVFTLNVPQCELIAAPADDNANDVIAVSCQLRLRDVAAGGGMFNITLT